MQTYEPVYHIKEEIKNEFKTTEFCIEKKMVINKTLTWNIHKYIREQRTNNAIIDPN